MSTLRVEISQGIATLTFDRPNTLNAITAEGECLLFDTEFKLNADEHDRL